LFEQSLKNTELVADTKGQPRMPTLMMIPMVLAAAGYIFKLAFS